MDTDIIRLIRKKLPEMTVSNISFIFQRMVNGFLSNPKPSEIFSEHTWTLDFIKKKKIKKKELQVESKLLIIKMFILERI